MKIQEAASRLHMTKRAIRFYEEKGLLKTAKDTSGYRDYTAGDLQRLETISFYRRLGISVEEIRRLLGNEDGELLQHILRRKKEEAENLAGQIRALESYIGGKDADAASAELPEQDACEALRSLLPGVWGEYLASHFAPFLREAPKTAAQREALRKIIAFCDGTELQLPRYLKGRMSRDLVPETRSAEEMISVWRDMDEENYEKLKEQTERTLRIRTGILRFHPVFAAQRRLRKQMQDSGYNTVVIENMKILSPAYAAYAQAMEEVNARLCRDLGVYYDSRGFLKRK